MNAQLISILSAVAAAVWSVWTWKDEQQHERQRKQDQESALFVNSFMLSIGVLQARLYAILEEDELALSREEGAPAGVEILYQFCEYFGWGQLTYRYGPFTKDPEIFDQVARISATFDSRNYPDQAFRFSMADRQAMGRAGVRPMGEFNPLLPAFAMITIFQFEEELAEKGQLGRCAAVRRAMEALESTGDLPGRERLAVLQNRLLNLQILLERKLGFSLGSAQQRRRVRLPGAAGQPLEESSAARILHQSPGRLRLGIALLEEDAAYAEQLQSHLTALPDVTGVRLNRQAGCVVVNYAEQIPQDEFARRVLAAL